MNAASFIALLRASNPAWHEPHCGDPPRWIFRGHRNVNWRLKPRAWRTAAEGNPLHAMIGRLGKAQIGYGNEIEPGTPLHRALAWAHAEKLVLNEFPAAKIPELRIMLERERITREKLMPTLENAAKAAIGAVSKPPEMAIVPAGR